MPSAKYRAFAFLTLAGGIVLLVWGGRVAWERYVKVYRWPVVNALSTGSRVNSHLICNSVKKRPTFEMEATFRYTVEGREYTANAGPGYNTKDRLWAYTWADQYKAGSQHRVHYNPADPREISAMEAGFRTVLTSFLLFAVGVLLTGIGIAAVRK